MSISGFLNGLTFLTRIGSFSQILESSLEVWRVKETFPGNPGHNILTLFNNLADVLIPTNKMILDIYYNKLGIGVASRVPERLKAEDLSKLGNISKSQIWVKTRPNAKSFFQKLNFDNSCQETWKVR